MSSYYCKIVDLGLNTYLLPNFWNYRNFESNIESENDHVSLLQLQWIEFQP